MIESPEDAAQRIHAQVQRRPDAKVYYIAWGSSLRFVAFTKGDHAFQQYGDDITRLVGAYRRRTPFEEILEDLHAFIREKGMIL